MQPGTRLGPYEIAAPLGAGGMGEVYRAKDPRLGRDVAIKILPAHLSGSPEMRARFEREARTISTLNHPHICVVHDVGREGETDFLVMELVEGETLAARLARGPLPPSEVLRVGSQIADALERAHRAGVVHRDLKPGNVMLTRAGAKLMDFGLARAAGMAEGPAAGALSQSPTLAQPLTAEGTLVGTFQYMSPEQLEGREADARSDLWALGCLLHEMATGRRAFEGKSQASLIGAIMTGTPAPISQLAPLAPPGLERLVRACLEKDPDERLQTAHDARLQLQWIAEGGSQAGVPAPVAARRLGRERLAWGIAAAGVVAAIALGAILLRSRGGGTAPVVATVVPPAATRLGIYAANIGLSPDGRTVAFSSHDSLATEAGLWVRPLDSPVARRLSEATDAWWPLWSPDGSEIAYFSLRGRKLMKIAVAGGSPTTICDAPTGRGGSWNRDGVILFAPAVDGPLMRVSAAGGTPTAVTALDTTRRESAHRFPCFLPDGEHFLYASLPARAGGWDIHVGSLRTGAGPRLLTAGSAAVYAAPGYLLFARDGRIMAQGFDARSRRLTGEPQPIADAPRRSDLDADPAVSASRDGRMAFLNAVAPNTRLEQLDETGAVRRTFTLPEAPWLVARTAPDGRRAALINGQEIWIVDLERSVPMRFAATTASAPTVAWSPDGTRLAFVTRAGGREEIHVAGMDGRAETLPTVDDEFKAVCDWSPDGRSLVFSTHDAETAWDLWSLPLDGDRRAVPLVAGRGWETNARVSPDGRWLAYQSTETEAAEVYVQSFPEPGQRVRISPDGGAFPDWSPDGGGLTYWRGATLMAVSVVVAGELRPGTPRARRTQTRPLNSRDRWSDGALVTSPVSEQPADIRIILDWPALLRR